MLINAERPAGTSMSSVETEDGKPHVLIVEDSASVRRFLVTALTPRFDVLLATGAEEAKDLLGRTTVDIILTDIMMPGIDGFRFFDQIQECFPTVPVVFMTGYQEGLLFDQARKRSPYLLTKPFHLGELERTLLLAVHGSHARRKSVESQPLILGPTRQRSLRITVEGNDMVPVLHPGDTLEIVPPDLMEIPMGALLYVRDGDRTVVRRFDRHTWTHGRPRTVVTDAMGANELAVPWDAVVGVVSRHRCQGGETRVRLLPAKRHARAVC